MTKNFKFIWLSFVLTAVVLGGAAVTTAQEKTAQLDKNKIHYISTQFMKPLRGPNYKEAGAQMFAAMTATLSDADKERVKPSFSDTPQHVLVSAMEAMSEDSLYGADKINVPVLAILAKSPFWPADTEQFLAASRPIWSIKCGTA